MYDLALLRELVSGTCFAEIRFRAETGSTNDDAAAELGTPASAGAVFLSEFQHAGRGRRLRTWHASPGTALLFTAVLPQPIQTAHLWAIPFWCALAVAEGIMRAAAIAVELRWPNDLLLGGKKCCGILATSRVIGDAAWVGCGIGVNVIRPTSVESLEAIHPPPSFLCDVRPALQRERVLAAILTALDEMRPLLDDPALLREAWERRAALRGTLYRIVLDEGETFEGIAERITSDGSLIVRTREDGERRVTLADARVLRSAPDTAER